MRKTKNATGGLPVRELSARNNRRFGFSGRRSQFRHLRHGYDMSCGVHGRGGQTASDLVGLINKKENWLIDKRLRRNYCRSIFLGGASDGLL